MVQENPDTALKMADPLVQIWYGAIQSVRTLQEGEGVVKKHMKVH